MDGGSLKKNKHQEGERKGETEEREGERKGAEIKRDQRNKA